MIEPREGPELAFDNDTIRGIRQVNDAKRGEAGLFDIVPFTINWLWHERVITTMEECTSLRVKVKELEKQLAAVVA